MNPMMKKSILSLFLGMVCYISAHSQDLVIKKDGTEIKAKVTEISDFEIKYRKWDNLEGPIYVENRRDILMIRYENGTNEILYKEITTPPAQEKPAEETIEFTPDNFWTDDLSILDSNVELKYKDLQHYYNRAYYDDLKEPYYSTSRAWFSFLIPGLAQYTMGEPGLGTLHLLMSLGGDVVTIIGGVSAAESKLIRNQDGYTTGIALICAGAALSLCFCIGSIVNAVDIAKVKSLYYDDLEDYKKVNKPSVGLKLLPSLNYAYTPTGYKLCPSLGFHLTF